MHPFLIHPGTVALNVCTTRSRESTAPSAVFYKATTVPGGAEVEVDCLTLSEWNPFRLVANLTWNAVFISIFFLLSMLVLCIILTIMTSNLIRFLSFPSVHAETHCGPSACSCWKIRKCSERNFELPAILSSVPFGKIGWRFVSNSTKSPERLQY